MYNTQNVKKKCPSKLLFHVFHILFKRDSVKDLHPRLWGLKDVHECFNNSRVIRLQKWHLCYLQLRVTNYNIQDRKIVLMKILNHSYLNMLTHLQSSEGTEASDASGGSEPNTFLLCVCEIQGKKESKSKSSPEIGIVVSNQLDNFYVH